MNPKDEQFAANKAPQEKDALKDFETTQQEDLLKHKNNLSAENETIQKAPDEISEVSLGFEKNNLGQDESGTFSEEQRLQEAKNAAGEAREVARAKREAMQEMKNRQTEGKTPVIAKVLPEEEEINLIEEPSVLQENQEAIQPKNQSFQKGVSLENRPTLDPLKPSTDALKESKQSLPKQVAPVSAKSRSKKTVQRKMKTSTPKWLAPFHALGAWFYFLGFAAECRVRWLARFLREVLEVFSQLGIWLLRNFLHLLIRFGRELLHIVVDPFVRIKEGIRNTRRVMREEQKKVAGNPLKVAVAHFKAGIQNHGHLFENLASILLPFVAVFFLVFLVYSIVNTTYGLEVSVHGETIGYIENETVLEEAKAILRGRLRLAGGQNMEDWQFDSTLELARADSFTTKDQLVNAMLSSGTAEVVEATGLYLNNELIAVTEDGQKLQTYLDETLEEYMVTAPPGAEVSFVNNVQCDPDAGEIFLDSGIQTFEELLPELESVTGEEVTHTVSEGETLGDISSDYNILFDTLLLRNPEFEEEDIEFEPEEGVELLIQREQPFLQVQTIVQESYEEALPFPVEEQPADDKPEGFRGVIQTGVDGVQQVQDELVYIDGELTDRIRLTDVTVVVQEAVPEIVQIGTVDVTSRELREYSPVYTWPVPDYTYSSRGGGPGMGHRGRDINGPEGTPVYASNAGVVITAGWHDSYGNYVVIDHPDGLRTLYAHNSFLHVEVGQEVLQNELIANMGNTGFSFGSHLHIEFQTQDGALLQPDDYIVPPHGYSL